MLRYGTQNHARKLPGKAHPNIYEAVNLFLSEQAVTEISLMQLAAGGQPKRRRKYRNYEKRFTTIKENYRYIGILLLDQSKAESMSAHALTHLQLLCSIPCYYSDHVLIPLRSYHHNIAMATGVTLPKCKATTIIAQGGYVPTHNQHTCIVLHTGNYISRCSRNKRSPKNHYSIDNI